MSSNYNDRITKRRILMPKNKSQETCRFQAVGCTELATTHNKWDVAMCKNCYGVWNSLRPNFLLKNGTPFERRPKMILRPKKNYDSGELAKEEDDEPSDEFYCGEY